MLYLRLFSLRSCKWISPWSSPAARCLCGHRCPWDRSTPPSPSRTWWTQEVVSFQLKILSFLLNLLQQFASPPLKCGASTQNFLNLTCWWCSIVWNCRPCSRSWGQTQALGRWCRLADRGSGRSPQRKISPSTLWSHRIQVNSNINNKCKKKASNRLMGQNIK